MYNLCDCVIIIFKYNVENNYDEKKSVIFIFFNWKYFVNIFLGYDLRIVFLDFVNVI